MARPSRCDAGTLRGAAPRTATVWGDGFAGNTLFDLWAVRDWTLCSPDEYILLFPRLIPRCGEVPSVLRAHLASCVAVRAWRLAKLDTLSIAHPLRSHLPDPDEGPRHYRDWFADDDAVTCLLRRLGLLRTAPKRAQAERAILTFLDGILFDIQGERVPARDEFSEALLAFGAGIHPAYIWPQAAVSPERGAAAGWLGHLDRGRTALVPLVVAEYVLDALSHGEGSSDRQMVGLSGGASSLAILLRAAGRRAAGHNPSIHLSPGVTSLSAFLAPGRSRRPLASAIEA